MASLNLFRYRGSRHFPQFYDPSKAYKKGRSARYYLASRPFYLFGVDVVYFLSGFKGPHKYCLTVVDYFSKITYLIPLVKSTADNVLNGLVHKFQTLKRFPTILLSDRGSENKSLYKLSQYGTKHIFTSPSSPSKVAFVENRHRFVRSILGKLKSEDANITLKDALLKAEHIINFTKSSVHGLPPIEVNRETSFLVLQKLRLKRAKIEDRVFRPQKFNVGDFVRVKNVKGAFWKSNHPTFTEKIFQVTAVKPTRPRPSYFLKNRLNDLTLPGSYPENLLLAR